MSDLSTRLRDLVIIDEMRSDNQLGKEAAELIDRLTAQVADLTARQASLCPAIAHGDDTHRAWLAEAISAHFSGKPVPPVVGKGNAELVAELTAERDALKVASDAADDWNNAVQEREASRIAAMQEVVKAAQDWQEARLRWARVRPVDAEQNDWPAQVLYLENRFFETLAALK